MSSILTSIFHTDISYAIFNTLLHSLWQIPVIALGIKLMVQHRAKVSKYFNYNANLSAIIMSLLAASFTFCYYILKSSAFVGQELATKAIANPELLIGEESTIETLAESVSLTAWISQYELYVVLFWSIGVLLLSSRIIAGWVGLRFLKKDLNYAVPKNVKDTFLSIKEKLGINRPIRIALSTVSNVPMVIGHIKPIILIPVATVNHLSIQELEAILAHELTHILQYDYIKNLVVMIGEAVFFYHPVIWMLTSEIKEDREHICDDTVMHLFPDRVQYAKTLVKLEGLYEGNSNKLSLALFSKKFKLMNRIKRILDIQDETNSGKAKLVMVGLLMCSLIVFSSAEVLLNETTSDTLTYPTPPAPPEPPTLEAFTPSVPPTPPAAPDLAITPPAPPAPPSINPPMPPAPPAPPRISEHTDHGIFLHTKKDTLDEKEREELREELKEKKAEIREKTKEFKRQMNDSKAKFKEEYKEELKRSKKALKEIKEKLGEDGRRFSSDGDFDFDEDELTEWAEQMGEWGERFGAKVAATFDDEWAAGMEEWGEEFGARFSERFGEDFALEMESFGEDISEIFDEEWVAEIEEMGSELAEAFDGEWLEEIAEMGEEIAFSVEEAFEDMDRDHYPRASRDTKTKSRLLLTLTSDDLLEDRINNILITDTEMIVNGKTMSKEMLSKYQRIVKRSNNNAFKQGATRVEFSVDGNNHSNTKNTSLSISVSY